MLFRGQAIEGGLLPGIARINPRTDTTAQEKEALAQLKLMGASFPDLNQPTQLDLLVVAQHSGLRTRLLDWTSNPLAALWFACADLRDGDTYVYALAADKLQKTGLYEVKDPFSVPVTRAFQPRLNNPRILAQHGWFTLHRYAPGPGAFVPLDVNPKTRGELTEIRIPAQNRADILRSLDRYGISRRTLFPDVEGLCRFLNWKFDLN
ncbi:FRG domain-containing protein (plasmid) [Paraburkholderia sprentiae WSM5005]|uniref:FRG domain-containing protein n=1 Tax=Paraburkholderia sprentiae WSM5005 TaxID=754502 RepID=A0A1I9YTZ3_9BURK|nr:FRG domain-containing protein [Paraburkholderia sprentiae WSM5005]